MDQRRPKSSFLCQVLNSSSFHCFLTNILKTGCFSWAILSMHYVPNAWNCLPVCCLIVIGLSLLVYCIRRQLCRALAAKLFLTRVTTFRWSLAGKCQKIKTRLQCLSSAQCPRAEIQNCFPVCISVFSRCRDLCKSICPLLIFPARKLPTQPEFLYIPADVSHKP